MLCPCCVCIKYCIVYIFINQHNEKSKGEYQSSYISWEDRKQNSTTNVHIPFGTAYLAIFEAINKTFVKKGILEKALPKSVDEYRKILRRHFAVHVVL